MAVGVAVLGVDGLDPNTAHAMFWYIDGNGECDDANRADAKATVTVPAGTVEAGEEYPPAVSRADQDICHNF